MCGDREIVRPSVPPVTWFALALWGGIRLAEALAWRAYMGRLSPGGVIVGTLAMVASALLFRRGGWRTLLTGGLAAGMVCGGLYWTRWEVETERALERGSARWVGEAVTDCREGRFGPTSEVRAAAWGIDCRWPRGSDPPEYGHRVEFYGRLRAPPDDENGRRRHQGGINGSISARVPRHRGSAPSVRGLVAPARERASRWLSGVPGTGGALLAGVVLGDRRRLAGTQADEDFRTTGLSHLVAVSGSHLVVVAMLAEWALLRMRVSRRLAAALVLVLLAGYVVLTGLQASAVRACLMSLVAVLARLSRRRSDGLAALAVAASVILALHPPTAFDVGFLLSVSSVAGLLVFTRLCEAWLRPVLPKIMRAAAGALSMTLVAQASTSAISVPLFGTLSLVSPLANLVAAPLVAIMLVAGLLGVAVSCASRAAGAWVLGAAGAAGALCTDVAHRMAGLPFATILVGDSGVLVASAFPVLMAAVWMTWPQPQGEAAARRLGGVGLLLLATVMLVPGRGAADGVVVLDVGQGDAILVRHQGRSMLVDAGPDEKSLRAALARQGVRRLDWMIATHLHDDHVGGAGLLGSVIPVGNLGVAEGAAEKCEDGPLASIRAPCRGLRAGDRIGLGDLTADVVWPREPVDDGSANDESVVLLVRHEGVTALLTGDAEGEVLDELCRSGIVGDIDVLKVGHHGSAGSVTSTSLSVLRPQTAVISVGEGNKFGHPTASTLSRLTAAGVAVERTDRVGDVELGLR